LSAKDSFKAYNEELSELKEEIDRTSPASLGESAFAETVKLLINELTKQVDEMSADMEKAEEVKYAIETARRQLDLFTYQIHRVLEGYAPIGLEYFLDQIMEDMHVDIPVLLTPGHYLRSYNVVKSLRTMVSMFLFPHDLETKFIWVIDTPQALVRDPLFWPLIVHEIAHAIEDNLLKTIHKFYPLTGFEKPESIPFITHEYAMEHEVDTIATKYIGPVYVRKVFEGYYYKEITISASHPIWADRIRIMLDACKDGDNLHDIRGRLGRIRGGFIKSDNIEHLPEILKAARTFVREKNLEFSPDTDLLHQVKDKLVGFKAYTQDMRLLLNAAYMARNEAISKYVKERTYQNPNISKEDLERISREARKEFDAFISDCIRLTRLRKLHPSFAGKQFVSSS
jgi:hypothetical protein